MRLATLALAALGVAAGYAAARALLERDNLPTQLPDAARQQLTGLQTHLRRTRAAAADVLAEVDQVTADAHRELTDDYLRRSGRDTHPTSH